MNCSPARVCLLVVLLIADLLLLAGVSRAEATAATAQGGAGVTAEEQVCGRR
ncbi:hypothetical protein ACFXPN_37175 [Streptomyces griseorubiginosus]|uniref:hypothetical protein n=1 Tax=Streptomyces griseorubiginosus TaxID=67304 RepID=UPI0036A2E85F